MEKMHMVLLKKVTRQIDLAQAIKEGLSKAVITEL